MNGYNSKEAMAGHKYNMSAKHRRSESKGMKKYEMGMSTGHNSERIDKAYKGTFGVNTMTEAFDMNRIKKIPHESRGYSSEAFDYDW